MNPQSHPASDPASSDNDPSGDAENPAENPAEILVADVLTAGRVMIDLHVSSKKRALEEMATLLVRDAPGIDHDTVFHALIDRERLGSTAVGSGVAIPHGRIADLAKPIGAFATLKRPLNYDAPDGEPVKLLFGLLVPAEANDTHIRLLGLLARSFQDEARREALIQTSASDEAWRILTA